MLRAIAVNSETFQNLFLLRFTTVSEELTAPDFRKFPTNHTASHLGRGYSSVSICLVCNQAYSCIKVDDDLDLARLYVSIRDITIKLGPKAHNSL